MSTTATSLATRRSQAERSASTRQALLDATIACLVEDGYANTTTSRVAERAGVSRGAHLHHFQTTPGARGGGDGTPRRAPRRGAAGGRRGACPPGASESSAGLDLLWAGYANPLFQAALDLWIARAHRPRAARASRGGRAPARPPDAARSRGSLFGDLAEQPDFDRRVEIAVATIRGLALLDTLHPGGARNRRQWGYCRARLVELFERAPGWGEA